MDDEAPNPAPAEAPETAPAPEPDAANPKPDGGPESLLDLGADAHADTASKDIPDAGVGTVAVTVGEVEFQVPKAVADRLAEIEAQTAETRGGDVPEGDYALTVPDALKATVQADPNDPLFKPVSDWARKYKVGQTAFDELVAARYQELAAEAALAKETRTVEKGKMLAYFGKDGAVTEAEAVKTANANGGWLTGLLKPHLKDHPDLANEVKFLTATAAGNILIDKIRSSLGEPGAPKSSTGAGAGEALSEEAYFAEVFRSRA